MPAINALLPIVAASNSQKESTQNRADESRASAVKSAASAVTKGLEQDAAAEKRMQEKRFINAYEEGIEELGREQERRAERVAAMELAQRDDAAALAASGNALPPVGEPLPTLGISEPSTPSAAPDSDNNTESPQAQVSNAPTTPNSASTEPEVAAAIAAQISSDESQQKAAADAFHALVSAQNGKASEQGILKQATLAPDSQGIASAATLDGSQQDGTATPMQGEESQAALPQTGKDSASISAKLQGVASAATLDGAQQADTGTPSQGQESLATLSQEGQVALPLTGQGTATLAAALVGTDPMQSGDEPEQAQLVRAWRGVDAQQLRSATAAATQSAQAAQASRQDPVAASVPVSFSGQIQQFAQSLRLAGAQPDAALSAAAAERPTASAPQGSAELSPWRADSASANAALSAGRATAANAPFAQAMQASNFGQPLGEAVGQNAWGESIAQRVSLMAGLKVSSAQIQLDPPELGAMTVKVSVNGDQASVSFHSPHALVRDALELSFPRLQEMLGQQGMQLVDAQVSDNSAGQGSGESTSGRAGQAQGEGSDEASGNAAQQIVQIAKGLIDFYA